MLQLRAPNIKEEKLVAIPVKFTSNLWCKNKSVCLTLKLAIVLYSRLVFIADRKARKLRNRLASAMRIDIEIWLGLTLRSSGRVCDIRSQVAPVQLLWTPTKFVGLLQGMETKNADSQCSFVLEVQFWSYSFMCEVTKCDICTITESSRNASRD